jgi:hypothetical protein
MKNKLLLLSSFIYLCSNAQQNFINVPSSEVTIKNKVFFQQQLNFNELIQSNSTLDYGLGKGFEVGANILGLNFNQKQKSFLNNDTTDTDPYNPLVLINGLKQFELSEHASIAAGTQFGVNFTDNKKRSRAGLTYVNFRLTDLLIKNSVIVVGTYFNSKHYGGQGNRIGAWVGTEIPIKDNFHIMAESVIGNNALCYTSVGVIYYPFKWMPLTLGVQIPNAKNNSYSIVFEFTIIPLAKKE